jgi:hypothetical protein
MSLRIQAHRQRHSAGGRWSQVNCEALLSALVDALGKVCDLRTLKHRTLFWLPGDVRGQCSVNDALGARRLGIEVLEIGELGRFGHAAKLGGVVSRGKPLHLEARGAEFVRGQGAQYEAPCDSLHARREARTASTP